jgi:hypothetical protein
MFLLGTPPPPRPRKLLLFLFRKSGIRCLKNVTRLPSGLGGGGRVVGAQTRSVHTIRGNPSFLFGSNRLLRGNPDRAYCLCCTNASLEDNTKKRRCCDSGKIQTYRVFCAVRMHRLGVTQGMAVTVIPETPVPRENREGVRFLCCKKTQSRAFAVTRRKSVSHAIYNVPPPSYPFFCPSHTLSRKIIMAAEKCYDKGCSLRKQLLYR